MKPRWRSEWMRPAASGAVAPRWTSQALVSSSPVVRKTMRSSSRQAAPTTWSRPPRSTPYPRNRSAASSGGSSAASASRAAATATVGRPSLASTSAARSAAEAASASARLSTARAGLRVRGAKFRSTLASSCSQWAVRRGVPWSSRSRALASTSASTVEPFTPALAFLAAVSAPPVTDSRSATVSSSVSSAAASTGSGALSPQAASTIARASASRRAPSPWAARPPPGPPADSPATSTNRAATFTRLRERSSSDRTSTRGSGTGTAATLALPAAPPAGAPARVSALKRVVLPLWGSPTMPTSFMGRGYSPERGPGLSTGPVRDALEATGQLPNREGPAVPDAEPTPASSQRSPVDVLRLVVAVAAFLFCLALAVGAENTMVGVEADLLQLADRVPSALAAFLVGLVQVVALVAPLVVIAVALVLRRFRLALLLVTVPVAAAVLEDMLASRLDRIHPQLLERALAQESWIGGASFPGGGWICGAAAATTVASPWLTHGI